MADSRVTVSFIWPPNFQLAPNFPDGPPGPVGGGHGLRRVVVKVDCDFTSDQTAVTDEVVLDISTLLEANGNECKRTVVEWVDCTSLEEATYVDLEWDRAPQVNIWSSGGAWTGGKTKLKAHDPSDGQGGDGTGDIVLSVTGPDATDKFTLCFGAILKDAANT